MISFKTWLKESVGFGPYIGNCKSTKDYQVVGACSDQNSEKKNKSIKNGNLPKEKLKKYVMGANSCFI